MPHSLAAVDALLSEARELHVGLRLTRRAAVLDEAVALLDHFPEADARSRRVAVTAERAIDAATRNDIEAALQLANEVFSASGGDNPVMAIALARATEARGRALAWTGTDAATREADLVLADAETRYAALGETQWLASVMFWRGNAVHFQNGAFDRALELMSGALTLLPADSPRRSAVLTFYADVLVARGTLADADALLDEAAELAVVTGDRQARAYASWTRARLAAARDDALGTERYVRETEREATEWFGLDTGAMFLADAAELLDRVGRRGLALEYLARAVDRAPRDEFVRQAQAALAARAGDPLAALEELQDLARGDWLEKRLLWRHTLLTAWASLRAGQPDAQRTAARAFETAAALGPAVLAAAEPVLGPALAPLAERAGSAAARRMLSAAVGGDGAGDDAGPIVRLFGDLTVTAADGTRLPVPVGQPGEVLAIVAASRRPVRVETVLDVMFPGVDEARARQRLRQLLTRLRAGVGQLVGRDGGQLRLGAAWVDVRAFRDAVSRVRTTTGSRRLEWAHAAIALWSGPPLPWAPYGSWAHEVAGELTADYLRVLDVVVAAAQAANHLDEAIAALTAAVEYDPYNDQRREHLAELLSAR